MSSAVVRPSLTQAYEILRGYALPLFSWYGLHLFIELWNSTLLALQVGAKGNSFTFFGLLMLIGFLVEVLTYFGLIGATVLAAGRVRGLETPYRFGPGLWLKDLTLEILKVLFFGTLGLIGFIIPGLVFFARAKFVPFIVLWEPEYRSNQVNALKSSLKLSKGHFAVLLMVLIVEVAASFLSAAFPPLEGPALGYALTRLIHFTTTVFLCSLVAELYFDIRKSLR